MPEYRAYILNDEGHINSYEPMVCADDKAAIAAAKQLVNGHDVELWQGARMVTTLAHKSTEEAEGHKCSRDEVLGPKKTTNA